MHDSCSVRDLIEVHQRWPRLHSKCEISISAIDVALIARVFGFVYPRPGVLASREILIKFIYINARSQVFSTPAPRIDV